MYETKDSGRRQEYASGMRRDLQEGKPDLLQWMPKNVPWGPDNFWYRLGLAAERGAQKYGRYNYSLAQSDEELERFKSSALRHMLQYLHGARDEDHAAAIVFNLMCAEMVEYKQKMELEQDLERCPFCDKKNGHEPWCPENDDNDDEPDEDSSEERQRSCSCPGPTLVVCGCPRHGNNSS